MRFNLMGKKYIQFSARTGSCPLNLPGAKHHLVTSNNLVMTKKNCLSFKESTTLNRSLFIHVSPMNLFIKSLTSLVLYKNDFDLLYKY